jgi:hypothetical protein
MKFKNLFFLMFAGLLATSTFTLTSCGDDDDASPAPTVALSATTFSGKIGETASVTATVVAEAGLKSLTITKYLGTTVDNTFGTNGTKTVTTLTHTETYELNEEGLSTPVRFKFEATDEKDQTASADFIITTEPSVAYLLTNYDWQWKSKVGKVFDTDPESEQILECEKDNVYSFQDSLNAYTLDYGALTGSGGGTCDFDGFRAPTTWSLNADESELTIIAVNVFDPNDVQTEVYKITEATATSIKSTQTIDLTAFGGIIYDWKFEWSAKPK